jgi:hypothetical protein
LQTVGCARRLAVPFKPEPARRPFHEAAADKESIANEIWSEADQIDRDARRVSES